MKKLIASVFLTSFSVVFAAEGEVKPVTIEQALKLGPEKLTSLVGGSEVGQDMACQWYATAKRLETENRLAKRDLRDVVELNEWRRVLSEVIDGFCNMAYGINGGGTMYTHMEARNDATLENFLADFSKLPRGENGKEDGLAGERLTKLGQFVAHLEIPEEIAKNSDQDTMDAYHQFRKQTSAALMVLQAQASDASAARVKAVMGFVSSQASLIGWRDAAKKPAKAGS